MWKDILSRKIKKYIYRKRDWFKDIPADNIDFLQFYEYKIIAAADCG